MRPPTWVSLYESLAGAAFENLDSLVQLLVDRIFRLGFIFRRGSCVLVLIRSDGIVDRVGHDYVGSNSCILNGLAAGRIIFRDGKDQGAAIGQVDRFLDRTIAKGFVADHVSASIL